MRVLIIILMLLWGCTKVDVCDPANYPEPPFGEPDITEIRKEQYYTRVTYVYLCFNKQYVKVIYTNHEDLCWHEDITTEENELCNLNPNQ